MSGSDMGSREQFSVPQHQHQHQHQHQPQLHQNMSLNYAADGTVYTAGNVNINGGGSPPAMPPGLGLGQAQTQALVGNSSESLKRKRGRPRKYGPDGAMSLSLNSTPPPSAGATSAVPVSQSGGLFPSGAPTDSASTGSLKRRGRPRGSVNKNPKKSKFAFGPGGSFTPHVITVKAGEDLSSKIMAVSQNDSRHVCILTANGSISNVTLRQPATSGGTVTYQGPFEILSLGGSLMIGENGGQYARTGGLSVSLSGPDGRVLGGGVAGLLIAASPVQVVLASFHSDGHKKYKSAKRMGNASAPKVSTAVQSSSPSHGTLSESSGGPGSPPNQSAGVYNNNNPTQGFPGMPWK